MVEQNGMDGADGLRRLFSTEDWERFTDYSREQVARGSMSWSLGELGDLFWMAVPETRPILVELAAEELHRAEEADRFLLGLSSFDIHSRIYAELVEPYVRTGSGDGRVATRCFALWNFLLRKGETALDPADRGATSFEWSEIEDNVLERLRRWRLTQNARRSCPEFWATVDAIVARLNEG